jgi:hypothetical protein
MKDFTHRANEKAKCCRLMAALSSCLTLLGTLAFEDYLKRESQQLEVHKSKES